MNTSAPNFLRLAALLAALGAPIGPAAAQVNIGVYVPGVSIGIELPLYPSFAQVPGQPVYYAPQQSLNLFFYDGLYWVYQRDNWYASTWYDGPWRTVGRNAVPGYVLRVPVRYYRNPPAYFEGWRRDSAPRWDQHWGHEWQQQHPGWQRGPRQAVPAPAPLPVYQRRYSGDRYPAAEQQQPLHNRNYRYQPRDEAVRQHAAPPPQPGPTREVRPAPIREVRPAPAPAPAPSPGRGNDRGKEQGRGPDKDDDKGQDRGRGKGQDKGRDKDRDDHGDRGRSNDSRK